MSDNGKFEMHCIVELFGHQRIAGKVSEQAIGGGGFIRVDVPKTSKREGFTKFYGPSAIYAMTPVSEQIAQIMAERMEVEPVSEWQLSQALKNLLPANVTVEDDDDDYPDEDYTGDPDDFVPMPDPIPDASISENAVEDVIREDLADNVEGWRLDEELDRREKDKRAAAAWARDALNTDFVILDTETTGFYEDDEIIQIGVIDNEGQVVLEQLVKPTKTIENSQYHGITDEIVKDAPTFPEVYEQLKSALLGKNVIAYNYDYDSRMVIQDCKRHNLEPILKAALDIGQCAMEQYACFYGQWNFQKGSYTWKKLRDALFYFDLKHEDFGTKEHDACTDARATLALIKKMAAYEPA